ncbi:MAG: bifunctional diguanylate cyclase/phosphodiesterase [Bacilli bacterium]|nr:bifunctional diguanylate cyclase/phosphodiesterase [Bacilli bacterium]
MKKKTNDVFQAKNTLLNPFRSTLLIIGIYTTFGLFWIFFSDFLLDLLVQDGSLNHNLQSAKGFFYVIVTALLFYYLIKRRMDSYYKLIHSLEQTIFELESANKQRMTLQEQIHHITYYDSLTGLLSKSRIIEIVNTHIQENPQDIFGLVFIDIDDFKHINEMKGHHIGDELLKLVAQDLDMISRPMHDVSRLGGDEFLILVKNVQDIQELLVTIQEGIQKLRQSYIIGDDTFYTTYSAGVAIYPLDGTNYDDLMISADLALHMAKTNGKDQIIIHQRDFRNQIMRQIAISNMLHEAILQKELVVYYQPLCSLKDSTHITCEALIRWQHPKEGFIPPLDFIRVAESTGLIKSITYFVFDEAIKEIQSFNRANQVANISINISTKMLTREFVEEIKNRYMDLQPLFKQIVLEVTESIILHHMEESIALLHQLKELGFRIALDDFGTGYSSLTYLQQLPIDILKIDQSFIKDTSPSTTVPFLRFFIELAHHLDIIIVFEGIEEESQKDLILSQGADLYQGYLFAKPMPATQLHDFYTEGKTS